MKEKRLLKAFWRYVTCVSRMEDALCKRSRASDFEGKHYGVHFGILVDDDKYAKAYRRWSARAETIEAWVAKNLGYD